MLPWMMSSRGHWRQQRSHHIYSHLTIFRADGKQSDGVSIIPWKWGRALVWDVTCLDTLSPSYEHLTTREARAVVAEMERRKNVKYAHLCASHLFVPVVIETFAVMRPEARLFCQELGRCITGATLDPLSHKHLVQQASIAVQRGNAAAVLGTLPRCSHRF